MYFNDKTIRRIGNGALYMLALAPLVFVPNILFPTLIPRLLWVYAAWAVLIGAAAATVWMRGAHVRWNTVDTAAGVFVAALVVAALCGVDLQNSLWSEAGRTIGVVWWLMWYGAYCAMRVLNFDELVRRRFFTVTTVALLLMSVVGILQIFGIIPTDQGTRVEGFFGNALAFGYYLAPFLLLVLTTLCGRRKISWVYRAFVVCAAVCAGVSLVFTETRGAMLGLIIGACVAAYIYFSDQQTVSHAHKKIVWGGVGCIIVLAAIIFMYAPARTFFINLSRFETVQTRLVNWNVAVRAARARPVLGWGWENYRVAVDKFFDPSFGKFSLYETRIDKPHNVYLEVLATSGVVGAASYIFLLVVMGVALWRMHGTTYLTRGEQAFLVGAFVAYLVENIVGFDTQMSLIFFLVVVWMCGARVQQMAPRVLETKTSSFLRGAERVAAVMSVVCACSVVWCGGVLPVRSSFYIQKALDGLTVHDMSLVDEAFHAERAWPSGPYFFESWRWMGHALLSSFALENNSITSLPPDVRARWTQDVNTLGALTHMYQTRYQNSVQWQMFVGKFAYQVARATHDATYLAMADAAFHRALELSPARDEARLLLAQVALARDNDDAAVASLLSVHELDAEELQTSVDYVTNGLVAKKNIPAVIHLYEGLVARAPSASWYAHLAAAYAAVGRTADARAAVAQAIRLDASYAREGAAFLQQLKK